MQSLMCSLLLLLAGDNGAGDETSYGLLDVDKLAPGMCFLQVSQNGLCQLSKLLYVLQNRLTIFQLELQLNLHNSNLLRQNQAIEGLA